MSTKTRQATPGPGATVSKTALYNGQEPRNGRLYNKSRINYRKATGSDLADLRSFHFLRYLPFLFLIPVANRLKNCVDDLIFGDCADDFAVLEQMRTAASEGNAQIRTGSRLTSQQNER